MNAIHDSRDGAPHDGVPLVSLIMRVLGVSTSMDLSPHSVAFVAMIPLAAAESQSLQDLFRRFQDLWYV